MLRRSHSLLRCKRLVCRHFSTDDGTTLRDDQIERAALVKKNSEELARLTQIVQGLDLANLTNSNRTAADRLTDAELALARDASRLAARARRGAQESSQLSSIATALASAGLDGPHHAFGGGRRVPTTTIQTFLTDRDRFSTGLPPTPDCCTEQSDKTAGLGTDLRERRDRLWSNTIERGTDAESVGWLLRGFYRDHGRMMDADEITEYELVLAFSSRELSDYITEKRPPPQLLGSNAVFKLMRQYFRYWSSEAGQHEPGGEYR